MLDDFLPVYDFHEVHRTFTPAPPGAVMQSARRLLPHEVPLLVVLMAIRNLPALLRGRRPVIRGSMLDAFRRGGFVVLEDASDELVLGAVGRFWRASGGLARIEPERFREFAEPGWAKAAFNFRVDEVGGRTIVSTETRILCTDEGARRKFRRYWLLIRPGSGAIRVAWLRAICRRAKRWSA
jgi:hypothetical protein